MDALPLAVALAAVWALVALGVEVASSGAFGRRVLFARPGGDWRKGVIYAFGAGMLPGAKESVQRHMPTYLAGIAYHGGLAASFGVLAASLALPGLPGSVMAVLRVVAGAGALAGAALLAKRALTRHLRALSCPDDYAANLLSTAFAALAALTPGIPALRPVFLVEATLLLLYLPLGKIRHCVFFFATRMQLGAFFGRRGVLPPPGERHA
jgi:hypothetical protein